MSWVSAGLVVGLGWALTACGGGGPVGPAPDAGLRPAVDAALDPAPDAAAPDATAADGSTEADAGVAPTPALYFPPVQGDEWATTEVEEVGWDGPLLEEAIAYAGSKRSTALIILHRGKILVERYWEGWDLHDSGPIFSASKSVTSVLIGLLLQDGRLDLDDPVSTHLGPGWSGAPPDKERLITIRHLLTMTSGLEDDLSYAADAGRVWYYNTPAYHELFGVIAAASGTSRDEYAAQRLHGPIGMQDAVWRPNHLTASARDMARFGLLTLADGRWDGAPLFADPSYLNEARAPSQDLNPSYGLLWWLNGQDGFLLPGADPTLQRGPLMPDAPADLIGALGAGDKKIYVVRSMDLVVVRHGAPTGEPTLAASSFDNVFWQKLMAAAR